MIAARTALGLALTLLTVWAEADADDYQLSQEQINAIPVIPSSEVRGIDVFSDIVQNRQREEGRTFEEIELNTNGNKDAAIASGLHVYANKAKKHEAGYARPRIGLVLSGGGARGGAHLGIIQAFERHHIPIDAIVGTSMGSFVGGLYASGMSSSEIERALTTLDWTKVISVDYERQEIPFRRKRLQRAFPGYAKVGVNEENEIVFGTGLFKRQNMLAYLKKQTYGVSNVKSFDDLRIPFRSVASRLEDGATVVLRDGSLAESIYASIAIPGGFDPITINGEVLVDGGVADNLPLDVMRDEMNVDYIVVVDISTPYDEHAKFDNYIAVMGQLTDILMRNNVEETIKSMEGKENEILITPDLTGYTPIDADKYPEIIAIGLAKGESVYNSNLSQLSLYETDYYEYLANRPKPKKYESPVIDKVELKDGTYLNDDAILSLLHVQAGEKLDNKQLDSDMADIYNLMIFDDVTYKVVEKNGQNVLQVITTPSWDVNGQIKFALGFEDNFDGHSDYSVKMEYVKFGLNSYAGEWRTRLTFGQENLLLTELYQPLNAEGHFYVRPALFYRNKKVYVSPDILADHTVQSELDETFTMQAKEYGGTLGLGVNITNDIRAEVGGVVKRVNPSTNFLATTIDANGSQNIVYTALEGNADVYNVFGDLEFDTLDNAFFPRKGYHATLIYRYSDQFNGDESTFSQLYLDAAAAYTWGRHTFSPHIKYGATFDTTTFSNSQDFTAYYTLGGLFNLSGLPTNAVTGSNVAFANVVYRYRLTDDGFFGTLSMPMFTGFSLETGNTWYDESSINTLKTNDLLYAGSLYVAADTVLGPFYLGVGTTEFDYYSFYISLGQSF